MKDQSPNHALVSLIVLSHYVLVEGALDTEGGRVDVKEIFRTALAAVPSIQDTREWALAMVYIEQANATVAKAIEVQQ